MRFMMNHLSCLTCSAYPQRQKRFPVVIYRSSDISASLRIDSMIIVLPSDDKTFERYFIFIVTSFFVSRLGVTHVEDCAVS